MKKLLIIGAALSGIIYFAACSGNGNKTDNTATKTTDTVATTPSTTDTTGQKIDVTKDLKKYDPHRGEGRFMNYKPGPFNPKMAAEGEAIYNSTCSACHKLTSEKLVGPGWKNVTHRHTAGWILNFLTNTDAMIDKDPELQKQLEICMVRMPNQNLTDKQAKEMYAFMRKNDGNTK